MKTPHFCFDEDAQEIYKQWAENLHGKKLLNEPNPFVCQHLSKFDKVFCGIALIDHLVECASGNVRDKVSSKSAQKAVHWCEYLESHARRIYGLMADDGLRAAQTLAEHIRKGKLKDGFTVRDIRRNQWRHLTKTEAIEAALGWLEDEHHVRAEKIMPGAKGGRPTTIFRINPAILEACKKSGE